MKFMYFSRVNILFLLFLYPLSIFAQTPPTGLTCAQMRAWVKANFYTGIHIQRGYNGTTSARARMYGTCDNQNNTVTCVYGGYTATHTSGSTATTISLPNGKIINCEHTVPQSFFGGGDEPMVSDMCHLFPTYETWNSDRGNYPFAELVDATTNKWEKDLATTSTSIPTTNINDYSEYKTSTSYEPREVQKGNTARAVLYFYTVYESEMASYGHPITDVAALQTLWNWHNQDPVTAADITRNDCIKLNQGNGNPYIDHPDWVAKAFITGCSSIVPVELISFEGKSMDNYNHLYWQTATEKNVAFHVVERKDKEQWREIGRVKAVGNTIEKQFYTFDDTQPTPLSMYRLRTMDNDGTDQFSKIITISDDNKAFSIRMYPNPAREFVTFETTSTQNQTFYIKITDIAGQILIEKKYNISEAGVAEQINIEGLPQGVYLFTFDNGVYKSIQKFMRY